MRSDKAFANKQVFNIVAKCPCEKCKKRYLGCAAFCEDYKKYSFIHYVLNTKYNNNLKAEKGGYAMRLDRINEWKQNRRWPKS